MTIVIEKHWPVPALPKSAGRIGRGPSKYPWQDMEVGDSFLAPHASLPSLKSAAQQWCQRHGKNWKFTARKTNKGTRIWRYE